MLTEMSPKRENRAGTIFGGELFICFVGPRVSGMESIKFGRVLRSFAVNSDGRKGIGVWFRWDLVWSRFSFGIA